MNPGDSLPDFDARTLAGRPVNYRRDAWQKKVVVLLVFADPASEAVRTYRQEMERRARELTAYDTFVLFPVGAELAPPRRPTAIIADRWGEVRFVARPPDDSALPRIDDLIEWLRFVQVECPECQGETK